jgi:glycosyltransferase involved in cell wall biosynthesis
MHLRCLMIHPPDTSPGQRYRLEQWQPHLRDRGVNLHLDHLFHEMAPVRALWGRPSPSALGRLAAESMKRVRRLLSAPAPDAYVLFREATMFGPAFIEALMKRRAPIIFDLDDAVWLLPDDYNPWSIKNLVRMPGKTRWIMRNAAAVSAGNDFIADFARTLCDRVAVVPTTIDINGPYARQKQHSADRELVVGWSGSHSTAMYIRNMLPALAEIAQRMPFRLLVIGAEVQHPGLDIECRPWRSATEVDDLLDIDIGLMPLVEDAWSSGKCGLKALQYMALGIPPVVSPIGVNTQIVRHGVNGFLASTPAEWRQAIEMLRSPEKRVELGSAARDTVRAGYTPEIAAERFAALARAVVQPARRVSEPRRVAGSA